MKNVVDKMMLIGINFYLYYGALQDIKERKLLTSYLKIGGSLGIIFNLASILVGTFSLKERILALLPGIFFLIFAKVTREKIGFGDGIILLILGNFFNTDQIWYVLQGALVLLMIFSILLLCTKRASGNCQIPFLPFLWLSQTILWGMGYV